MNAVKNYSGVDGGKKMITVSEMNNAVGARPGRYRLMTLTTGTVMVK